MKMLKGLNYILFTVVGFIYFSCANQSQPTGGPKDEDPPQLLKSSPEDQSLNFKGKEIELRFNEMVKTDNLTEQLIITPSISGEYDFKVRNDRVILEFEEGFEENTTYTLNFRDGIKDVTESNPAENLVLAFSTGPVLDSLSLNGVVKGLLTGQPVNNFTVGLYKANDTLHLFNSKPFYLAKTDAKGNFNFRNLKADNYKIASFKDANRNLICESENEIFGFVKETIKVDTSTQNIEINVQFLDMRDLELVSARQQGKYFLIRFNKYITDYSLESLKGDSLVSQPVDENSTIKIYNTFQITDSLGVSLTAADSLGSKLEDTVYVKFEPTERDFDEFNIGLIQSEFFIQSKILKTKFTFDKPVGSINTDSIFINIDSANYLVPDSIINLQWNSYKTELNIDYFIKNDTVNLQGKIFRAAEFSFQSIEGDTSSSTTRKTTVVKPSNRGIVKVQIDTSFQNFWFHLLDDKFNLLETYPNQHSVTLQNLKAGKYQFRILVDENNNGTWDPGNFYLNMDPEPVVFFKDPESGTQLITVRENWELGPYVVTR